MRICVVSPAFGILAEDEITAAVRHLAGLLAAAGAAVTLLQAGDGAPPLDDPPAGVTVAILPPPAVPFAPCAAATSLSYRCRDWLAAQEFDLALFPDRGGLAYYPVLARRQRLALEATAIAVLAWGPSLWLCQADGRLVDDFDLVVMDWQERRAAALADALVAPHDGMPAWMRAAGWDLPAEVVRLPLPPARPAAAPAPAEAIRELVYAGGLERRDGLLLFCAAVERLGPLLAERGIPVRLLGPARPHPDFDAQAHLAQRMSRWPFPHALEAVALTAEALAERLGPQTLAVLPAAALGEPLVLQTCRSLGVPLLAGDAPGAAELLPAEHLAPLTPPLLAERLAAALEGPPPAAPPASTAEAWAALAARLCAAAVLPPPAPLPPVLVSVCLSHFNRPELLERAVASVLAQSWRPLEVIVVDDGSSAPALARLAELEAQWGAAVTVIRQPNRYLGAARNRAAAAARGEFLLFMDDDNVARPEEVATLLRAAHETGADVLTTVIHLFEDDDALARGDAPTGLWVPLGGCAAAGLYSNTFGDANALIRRSAFDAVGGFSEAFGLGLEDWELFAKLALAGLRFDVAATPLLWYRQNSGGMLLASVNRPAELRRAIGGPLAAVPPALAPGLLLAQGLHFRQDFYRREYRAAADLLEQRLADLRSVERLVDERDATITEQAAMLDERWRAMQEMTRLVDERDATIAEQTRLVDERDAAIAGQGRMLEERWAAMTHMEQLIADRDATIAQQAEVIADQTRQFRALPCRVLRKLGMLG